MLNGYAINEKQQERAKELEEIGDLSSEISAEIGQLSPEQFKVFKSLCIPGQTTDTFGTLQSAKKKMSSETIKENLSRHIEPVESHLEKYLHKIFEFTNFEVNK